ncbi:MAG TPA: multicopper oxidase domain-containing protein [Gemmatimonadaceae bacterium]|nr:multicopper oxidase domain-containing protein [Gemmatimonadaceae bacterium]
MRVASSAVSAVWFLVAATPSTGAHPAGRPVERIINNDNRVPAGELRQGVLTIRLEAREGDWRPDGDSNPGLVMRAFAEEGKAAQVPGPLIRVPEGTEIHAFVRNTFTLGTLVVRGLSRRGMSVSADRDTIHVAPGATREVRFVAGAAGAYYYSGSIVGAEDSGPSRRDAELSGAFIIDPAGIASARDRVLVIGVWLADTAFAGAITSKTLLRFSINGRSWPNTERLTYALGDTVRFRVINVSNAVHPMHLHGFYFTVDARGDGTVDSVYGRSVPPYRVVTERLAAGRTFSMTWVAERAGNWMFHCHDNYHVLRNWPLDGSPASAGSHATYLAHDMMGGLVMGIQVRGRDSSTLVMQGAMRRKLRLVARVAGRTSTESEPAFGYDLQDRTGSSRLGPTILLKRGEPVSITVVNQLSEPTSVHWHGIELESYYDGVPGFAGSPNHIAPPIAPGDSFEARFTPPRAGTFIFHPHADEFSQQRAGLSGALLVVDDPRTFDPASDIVLLLAVPRREDESRRGILINGSMTPAPLEMHVGERYRLRIIDIHTFRPSMIVRLIRDSTVLTWQPVAKDGMPIPAERAQSRPAQQQMGNGETYDFEFTPTMRGILQVSVTSNVGVPLGSVPIHVR